MQKSYSELDGSFFEKIAMSQTKIFSMGKHFQNLFRSKKFRKFFDCFWSFLPKKSIFWVFGSKILIFTHFIRIVLRSFCAIARFPTSIELCGLTRFIEFLPKIAQNRGFSKCLGQIIFFEKIFCSEISILIL